ncbi:MAG: hydrocarbon degradation protein, partial [Bacteroidota bacterium]
MNVFKPLGISLALIFSLSINAQNFSDALRYSNFDPIGTARFMGTGSALGPLGADFSVMSTNPAGLGWLRKSE